MGSCQRPLSIRFILDMFKSTYIFLTIILVVFSYNSFGQKKIDQSSSEIVFNPSGYSLFFHLGINSIDFKGNQFEGFRFSAGLAEGNSTKKVYFQLCVGYSYASNHDSTAYTYDRRLVDTVLVYLNTRLDRIDFKPELKYRFQSTLKKERFVSFALMFNGNFLSKKIVNPSPQMDLINEKSISYSVTPMLSYSKEKRLDDHWRFTGELSYGINLPTQTSYYYAGIGFRYRI